MAMKHHGAFAPLAAISALLVACAGAGGPGAYVEPASPPHADLPARDFGGLVDFDAVRRDYGARPDFLALCGTGRPIRPIARRMQARDWPGILHWTRPWLNGCPVDIEIHAVAAQALFELSMPVESSWHAAWYRGLLDSILASGDGRTSETAWVVISVAEEYAILKHLGYELIGQSLTSDRRDAMQVRSGGEEFTVYFHPEAHWQRFDARMSGADAP